MVGTLLVCTSQDSISSPIPGQLYPPELELIFISQYAVIVNNVKALAVKINKSWNHIPASTHASLIKVSSLKDWQFM